MMIKNYLASRASGVKFLLLALLFSLFVADPKSDGLQWGRNIAFLFVSFMVFRFIDDAGSVSIDRRKHPERTYLHPLHYPLFLRWTIALTVAYLFALRLIDLRAFWVLTALIMISCGLYLLFRKREFLLELVPLLKYPVLLWCLTSYSTDPDIVAPLTATFFIVFTHDRLEQVYAGQLNLFWAITPLLLSGFLISRPWNDPVDLWFILPVLILTLAFKRSVNNRYLPILYYSIVAFGLNTN